MEEVGVATPHEVNPTHEAIKIVKMIKVTILRAKVFRIFLLPLY